MSGEGLREVVATRIGVSSCCTGLGMAGPQGAQMSPALASAPVNGSQVNTARCGRCHGAATQGDIGSAVAASRTWSETEFAAAVLRGKAAEGCELSVVVPRVAQAGLNGNP